jgi:hypothetical protein
MSYSIREDIDELKEKLESEIAIAEKFPDAILRGVGVGRRPLWTSESVVPTDFEVFVAEGSGLDGRYFFLLGYVNIGSMRVYQDRNTYHE